MSVKRFEAQDFVVGNGTYKVCVHMAPVLREDGSVEMEVRVALYEHGSTEVEHTESVVFAPVTE